MTEITEKETYCLTSVEEILFDLDCPDCFEVEIVRALDGHDEIWIVRPYVNGNNYDRRMRIFNELEEALDYHRDLLSNPIEHAREYIERNHHLPEEERR